MPRTQNRLFIVLFVIAFAIWGIVAWRVGELWRAPLGVALQMPPTNPLPVTFPPTREQTSLSPQAPAAPTSTMIPGHPTLTPYGQTPVNQPLCGGPVSMNILAIGSDSRASGYLYGLSDIIRLVRVDFGKPGISVLEFPRDLWVEIPDISEHYNIHYGKLNQAYLYGNPGMGYYTGQGEGPGLLARTLELNFGAHTDNYIAINMRTFVRLVDAVGGLDIYLPYTVDGRKSDQQSRWDLYFKAGAHHLDGQQALMLSRLRIGNNTDRIANQNIVLCALRDALLNPYNLPRLPQIIDSFDGAVQTDLSPQQLAQLACLAPYIRPENIKFARFPSELLIGTRVYEEMLGKDVFVYTANFDILRQFVTAFNDGLWPGQVPLIIQPGGTPPPSAGSTFTCP